jgi:DNA polymerase-3 subunit epsilon
LPLIFTGMFAIIDIETCAGKYEYRKGRITEICIIQHDGLQVTDVFTTLLNPECRISPYFESLSGITNEMVKDAPKFHEVAAKIIELTEGRVFIAHNVGFDYGFIKAEFASLGYKYRRDTLCTVRLSRKFMPGKLSYSLGKLCGSIGIEIHGRHRAEGDAVATAELFNRILDLKSIHPQYKNQGVESLMTRRIDKIKQYILDKLPEACGVYYFLNKDQEIIYIGKSVNVYNRAVSHFNTKEAKGKKMLNDLYNVDFVETGCELIALLMEAEEIKKHKPKYNRMRKSELFTHSIDWFRDDAGIVNFKLVAYEDAESPLMSFTGYLSAREQMEKWIEDQELCLRYCQLTGDESVCFDHQIKKCRGICAGEEEATDYNKRAQQIVDQLVFKEPSFALIDAGKTHEDRSVILVENRKFVGYGYIDRLETFSSLEECRGIIKKARYYPDADILIKSYLRNNKMKKVVFKESVEDVFPDTY